jgi:serine/threonine-protein kinase
MSLSSYVRVAGRYELGEVIAMGGFGEVWRATDTVLARPVAVKLLLADHVQHPQALARFRTEAQRAGSLSHENIARVYDYLEPEPPEPPFLVMELVDGPSVAQLMSDGPLSAAWAMHIVAGAAAGLEAAHRAGVVHRDIKPANLLLTRDRRVKVTDFGISYAVNSAPVTSTGQILGTSGYMAPERLNGTGVTTAVDLYALGVVAYECLTGAAPFTGTPIEVVVAHRDQPLPPLPATVPPGVAALIRDLTAKDPAARPGSAGEVASRAAQLRDDLTPAPSAVPSSPAEAAAVALPPGHDGQPAQGPDAEELPAPAGGLEPEAVPPPAPGLEPAGFARPAPKSPAHSARGVRWAVLAGALTIVLAVIGLVIARSAGMGSPSHNTAGGPGRTTPTVSTVQMIEVNAASLLGRPVTSAARQLRQLGLPVRIVWQRSQQSPGTVLAVQPSGQVAPHTVVTLTAAGQPAGSSGQPGAVTVGQPSPGARPGGTPAGNPAPASGTASSPASGTGTGSSPTPSASASPSTGNGDGNGNGNDDGGGKGNGKKGG